MYITVRSGTHSKNSVHICHELRGILSQQMHVHFANACELDHLKLSLLSGDSVEDFVSNKIGMMFDLVPTYCELFKRLATYFTASIFVWCS
jgi:hypothetical protein